MKWDCRFKVKHLRNLKEKHPKGVKSPFTTICQVINETVAALMLFNLSRL